MEQVYINNVFQNSIYALAQTKDGKISVKLAASQDRRWVGLTFSDNGAGIAPVDLDKVFQPFFITKQAGAGTEMGLSIIRRIVGDYLGDIHCDSKANEGTTLTITFPVEQPNHLLCRCDNRAMPGRNSVARVSSTVYN